MIVFITGPQEGIDYETLYWAICASNYHITEIVSARLPGYDRISEMVAQAMQIPLSIIPKADPTDLVELVNAVLAIWDGIEGESEVWRIINKAREIGKPCYIYRLPYEKTETGI